MLVQIYFPKVTNKNICYPSSIYDEYNLISNTLLTPPPDTASLMELIAYIKKVEDVLVDDMEDKLRNVMRYIMFLGDYTIFSPLELKANNQTFHWSVKLGPYKVTTHDAARSQDTVQ